MADQESPDSLAIEKAGVKRLNSRPIFIVVGVGALLVLALVYAINQSAKRSHPQAQAVEDQPQQKVMVQDSKAVIQDLTKGEPQGGDVPDASSAKFVAPEDKDASNAKAGDQDNNPNSPAGVAARFNDGSQSPQQQWIAEYKTEQDRKFSVYEAALNAPTKISTSTGELKATNPAYPGQPVQAGAPGVAPVQPSGDAESAAIKAALGDTDPNGQDEKNDFASKQLRPGYLNATREMPLSRYEIKMGTIIPAILISGVNSDLPGELIAQVSQDVWDTATGQHLLIPQGSKLFGIYDSRVMFGQNRVLIAWTRITFPDASTLDLGHMSGADQAGYAGFADKINNHYVKIFGSALLMSIISAGVELSQPPSNSQFGAPSNQQTAAAAMAQQLSQVGNALLQKNLNIQPTIEIRPGYRFNVMVSKDVILPSPYRK